MAPTTSVLAERGSVPISAVPRRKRRPNLKPLKSATCIVLVDDDGNVCGRRVRANERCPIHYETPLRCRVCGKNVHARELCVSHYRLWRLGRPLTREPTKLRRSCSIFGCHERIHARGLCLGHYRAFRDQNHDARNNRLAHNRERYAERHPPAEPEPEPPPPTRLPFSANLRRVIESIQCPHCGAWPGTRCHDPRGRDCELHDDRINLHLDTRKLP